MKAISSFPILVVALVLVALVISCAAPTSTPVPKPTATEPSRITPLPAPTPTASGPMSADAIMSSNCTGCHTLERVVSAKKTREQWEQTVVRMVRLSAVEQPVLLDYLAMTYKP